MVERRGTASATKNTTKCPPPHPLSNAPGETRTRTTQLRMSLVGFEPTKYHLRKVVPIQLSIRDA